MQGALCCILILCKVAELEGEDQGAEAVRSVQNKMPLVDLIPLVTLNLGLILWLLLVSQIQERVILQPEISSCAFKVRPRIKLRH